MATKAIAPWQRRKLAEVAEVRTGIAKNNEKALTDPVELPYLRVANVQDGHLDLTEIKTIAVESSRVERYSLEDGDVLMTEGGDFDKLGRGAVWRNQISPCLHQNHVFSVRVNRKHLLPEFLAAYCAAEPGRRYFLACSKQTTNLASINSSQLKDLPLQLPSLDEQRRIVCVLDAADRQIQLAEKIAHEAAGKVLAMTSSLVFQGLRSTAPFDIMKSKRLAKRGWKRTTIAQIASEVRRVNREGMALPVLSSTKQKGIVFSDDYFGKQVYSANTSTYKRVRRGEFVYATNHIEEGSIGMQDICDEGLVSPMYTVFELDEPLVDPYFLIALLKTETYRQIFSANTSASVDRRGSLRWKDFSRLPVHLPDMDLQREVAAQIAASKRYLEICNSRLNGMREQKRGLMQQLLTGQHRLTRDLPGMEPGDV